MYREIEEKYPEPPDMDDKIHEWEIEKEMQAWTAGRTLSRKASITSKDLSEEANDFFRDGCLETNDIYRRVLDYRKSALLFKKAYEERERKTEITIDQWATENSINLIVVEKLKDKIFKEE